MQRVSTNIHALAPTIASRFYVSESKTILESLKTIRVERPSEAVVHVRLYRPETRNAFTPEMWSELHQTFDHLDTDRSCRAIVLSGAGASFCAGIDLKLGFAPLMKTMQERSTDVARRALGIRDNIKRYQDSFSALERCRKPIICAIHSHCFGAATSLITAADVRFASKCAQLSVKEVDVGLAADVGVLQRIQRVVGNDSWTRDIVYSARTFDANEALQFGLISRVLETGDACIKAALDLAAEIATKSPVAVEGSKLALNHARNNTIDASLEWMVTHNAAMLQTVDTQKIAKARAQKQQPEFEDA